MKKCYLYVGNWSFEADPKKGKGISVYAYHEESGSLEWIETVRPDIAAGQLMLDAKQGILYSNDECGERRGEIGGGGYLYAFRIDPETGELTEMNHAESLCPEPSYLYEDPERLYLTVCHCSDPWHVTKLVRQEDGTLTNRVLFDDTGLVLFRLREDGSIGDAVDADITEGTGGIGSRSERNVDPVSGHVQLIRVISRLHSVVGSPSGKILVVCDKGMDRIYTYRINRKKGKLVRLCVWEAPEIGCFPRYSAFHPVKKVFYANNENLPVLNTFSYDDETGEFSRINSRSLLDYDPGLVEGKPVGAQDILVHPSGRVLYCTLIGLNVIVVCSIDEDGIPIPVQRIPVRGILPRGIALSPDAAYLFSGNMISGDITAFLVKPDGTLSDTGVTYPAVSPSALRFFTTES